MSKFKASIKSMRLRTLPLSCGGVILGILLAAADFKVRFPVAVLIVLTTVCLQVLSNLSNELGDMLHGTDTPERQGPDYGMKAGLTVKDMKRLIGLFVVLCIISGTAMTWLSFGTLWDLTPIMILLLGGAAILAAMKYTLGRNPYGYRGLGDLYVFIFFGIVAVAGAYFVAAHDLFWRILLPGAAVGCFGIGVLNVNNIRDMKTDAVNRRTVALRLGLNGARIYQTVLIALGWIFMAAYCLIRIPDPRHWLWALTLPLYIIHLRGVWTRADRALDPMLPLLVMSTFLFDILAGLGFVIYLF